METIGRYQLIEEIGRGGMGTVYRATDTVLGREVALKLLPGHLSQEQTFLQRFQREAQIVARLQHPHIIAIFDFGTFDGQPFITMPLLTGDTLRHRIEKSPILPEVLWPILKQIAAGLDIAHNQQIVHRDIKPNNILFDAHKNAFISDFGIARALDGQTQLTGNAIIGSPAYMSPEQFKGSNVDARSDQYSLAIVTYEALTGVPPFVGDTAHVMYQHLQNDPPEVHLNANVSSHLTFVLRRALAKNPQERFSTVTQFVDELISASRFVAAQTETATLSDNEPNFSITASTTSIKNRKSPEIQKPNIASPQTALPLESSAVPFSPLSSSTYSEQDSRAEISQQHPLIKPGAGGKTRESKLVKRNWLVLLAISSGIILMALLFWLNNNKDDPGSLDNRLNLPVSSVTDSTSEISGVEQLIASNTPTISIPISKPVVEEAPIILSVDPGNGGLVWETNGEIGNVVTKDEIAFMPGQSLRLNNGVGVTSVTLPGTMQLFLDDNAALTLQTLAGVNEANHTNIQVRAGTFLIASQNQGVDIEAATGDTAAVIANGLLIITYREDPFWFQADCLRGDCIFTPQGGVSTTLLGGSSICIFGESCAVSGQITAIAYEQYAHLSPLIPTPSSTPTLTHTPTPTFTPIPATDTPTSTPTLTATATRIPPTLTPTVTEEIPSTSEPPPDPGGGEPPPPTEPPSRP